MRLRNLTVLLLVAVVLGIVIYACYSKRNGPGAENSLKTITMGTFSKALGNSPYHIAKHFKWFEEEANLKGVTLNFKEFNDRPSISQAFSNGDLQILFSGDAPAILNRAQGNDIRLIAVSGNAAQEILVRSELPIKSVSELRGKTIAVLQGTTSQYALIKILNANGLGEKDVEIQYMSPAEAKVAFETNKIDAWAVWAPFVEQQQVSGKGKVLPGSAELINSIMTVSSQFITDHDPAVRSVVAAVERAKRWMISNPDEAQRIMAEELGLDPQVVKTAWGKFNWSARLDETIVVDLQNKADFLASADKTRSGQTINVRKDFADLRYETTGAK